MPSQITTRKEYLLSTDNTLVLVLHSNLIFKKINVIDSFSKRFNYNSEVALLFIGSSHFLQVTMTVKGDCLGP